MYVYVTISICMYGEKPHITPGDLIFAIGRIQLAEFSVKFF